MRCGVDEIVIALCLDYERRESAIRTHSVTHRTEMEYRYLNYKLFSATAQIVGTNDAVDFIREIGERLGYAKSDTGLSEKAYKELKREVKSAIAKNLHLID